MLPVWTHILRDISEPALNVVVPALAQALRWLAHLVQALCGVRGARERHLAMATQ